MSIRIVATSRLFTSEESVIFMRKWTRIVRVSKDDVERKTFEEDDGNIWADSNERIELELYPTSSEHTKEPERDVRSATLVEVDEVQQLGMKEPEQSLLLLSSR